jgi:hypothetical protein
MALRIGLLGSSALQNDGHIKPVILQCRTPQETNPKGHWESTCLLIKSLFWWWWWSIHGSVGVSNPNRIRRFDVRNAAPFEVPG